jgi:putative phosphoesterase
MRIALISDIHGNLPALDAALADIHAAHVDQIICLGDIAASGPYPREAVARVRELGCPVIRGNHDDPDWQPPASTDEKYQFIGDILQWSHAQLSEADLTYLRTFPPRLTVPLANGTTLLCFHGSPHSYDDLIVGGTSDDDLACMLAGFDATVMAGGHTHKPLLRRHQGRLFINPGSVGLAFERMEGLGVHKLPWAEYAVLHCADQTISVEFRRAPFDVAVVKRAALERQMPHAEWWNSEWS